MSANHRLCLAAALVLSAAVASAALAAPRRPFAKLDPPDFKGRSFGTGELTGWYAVFYVSGRRIVCANPTVWDGPKVVSCSHLVAVDTEAEPAAAEPTAPLPVNAQPIFPDYPTEKVEAAVDLWAKRLTFQTRNATR